MKIFKEKNIVEYMMKYMNLSDHTKHTRSIATLNLFSRKMNTEIWNVFTKRNGPKSLSSEYK